MEKQKKEKQLKASLIVVGALGVAFGTYGLVSHWTTTDERWTFFMGIFCGLTLLFSGLGITELNGELKKAEKC